MQGVSHPIAELQNTPRYTNTFVGKHMSRKPLVTQMSVDLCISTSVVTLIIKSDQIGDTHYQIKIGTIL